MAGPWEKFQQPQQAPWVKFSTAGTGPKAPTGFGDPANIKPVAPIPGGPDDLSYIAGKIGTEEGIRSRHQISTAAAIAKIQLDKELQVFRAEHPELSDSGPTGIPKAAMVQALIDGRMAFPAGAAMRSPYWQDMLAQVARTDPSFDAVNFNARSATRKDFTSGKAASNVKSLNTAIGHLGHLNSQIAGTASHGGFPFATGVNAAENFFSRTSGSAGPTLFDQTAGALASELTQVFRGSGGAEADVKRYLGELSPNASMEQKQAAIKNIASLLQSRLEAVGDQYKQGMGKTVDPLQLLNPHAQQAFSAILGPNTGGADGGPTGGANGGGGPAGPLPGSALATSGTHAEHMDPKTQSLITGMIQQGLDAPKINAVLGSANLGSVTQETIDNARKSLAAGGKLVPAYEKPNSVLNNIASSPAGVFLGSAADGALGGMTDELGAIPASLATGSSYADTVRQLNDKKQAAFKQDWKSALAGGITGGGLSTAGIGMGLKGLGVAGELATTGANTLYGMGYGAGADNGNRMQGAGLGILGSVVGEQVGNLAGRGLGALARTAPGTAIANNAVIPAINAARSIPKVGGMFGAGRIAPLATAAKPSAADNLLLGAVGNPDDVTQTINNARSLAAPFTLADASTPLTQLAGQVVRRSPDTATIAENALLPRANGQYDRLRAGLSTDLGPVDNVPQLSEDLGKQAKTAAAPLYADAYAAGRVEDPAIKSLMKHPELKDAYARAKALHANDTALAKARGEPAPPPLAPASSPDVQTIDYITRGLRTKIDSAYSGDSQAKMNLPFLKEARTTLLAKTDTAVPAFGQARAAYGGPMQSKDALEFGQGAINQDPNQLAIDLGKQSDEQKAQAALGFRYGLADRAGNANMNVNPWRPLDTPNTASRLDALYPGNPGNQTLMDRLNLEKTMARNTGSILQGSQTAGRHLQDQAFTDAASDHVGTLAEYGDALAGGPAALSAKVLFGAVRKGAQKRASENATNMANQLAPVLFDPNTAGQTIQDLIAKQQAYKDFVGASRPRLGGMFAGAGARRLSGGSY